MAPNTPSEPSGSWDSIHVFEAAERGRQAHYKLTSTIMLQLVTHKGENETGEGKQHAGSTGVEGGGKGKGEGWSEQTNGGLLELKKLGLTEEDLQEDVEEDI